MQGDRVGPGAVKHLGSLGSCGTFPLLYLYHIFYPRTIVKTGLFNNTCCHSRAGAQEAASASQAADLQMAFPLGRRLRVGYNANVFSGESQGQGREMDFPHGLSETVQTTWILN